LLEKTISDEEYKLTYFDNFDKYSKEELDTMTERYSIGADSHLKMLEEFDDPSYKTSLFPNYEYQLNDVFVDRDETEKIIEKINTELTPKQIKQHINMVVDELPVDERVVFELSIINGLSNNDIASIRKIDVSDVDKTLKLVRERIIKTFIQGYDLA